MKRIEAIIRPHKQALVLAALAKAGITNVTVLEILGLAHQVSFSRTYEVTSFNDETQTGLIPKRMLLLFVKEEQVQRVLEIIRPAAFTGESGDGIISVSAVDEFVQIRSK